MTKNNVELLVSNVVILLMRNLLSPSKDLLDQFIALHLSGETTSHKNLRKHQ